MRILIVGAGIAGLALAKALELRGFAADLIERGDGMQPAGAGLYMPGNTTRAIGKLGLLAELQARAVTIQRQRFLDRRGRPLFEVNVDDVWQPAGACMSARRSDVQEILTRSLRSTTIEYGRHLVSVEQTPQSTCVVLFDDGSRSEYDLVVGADGIHSVIRGNVISPQPPLRAGFACWRYITANRAGIRDWTVMLGGDRTLLAIPISESEVYVYADLLRDGEASLHASGEELRATFRNFDGPVTPLLADADRLNVHSGLIETVTLPSWVRGRVVLVGDAAHASSPSMAEGAGMALEDALVLAEEVASNAEVDVALQRFQARRQPRANWVQEQASARDNARKLPSVARTAVLKLLGKRIYRRNYLPLLASE